jgi:hypothetical protein
MSDELSERMSYPIWVAEYDKGGNEDIEYSIGIYFQTGNEEFRLHSLINIIYLDDYKIKL